MSQLKFALRSLTKTPFLTAVAALSLALGIGANAAIFSIFHQILLRPLPVSEPDRLVNLGAPGPKPGSQSCNNAGDCDEVFSYPMFLDLQRAEGPFSGVAAHRTFGANVAIRNQTRGAEGMMVSGSYFSVLGVRPSLGRLITEADDRTIGEHAVAVLGHGYWTTHLGGDPTVLDETIVINGRPMTVIGVAPPGFDGTTLGTRPDLYIPITMRATVNTWFDGFEERRSYWAYLFARLKPGQDIDAARSEINTVYRSIINDVEAPLQEGMSDQTMGRFRAKQLTVEPGQRGQSSVDEDARTPLLLLFGITGLVLLIACANIANLLLARGAGRSQEMAIRGSLGASRGRMLTQLLMESCLLALLGGVASLIVARGTLGAITSILPPDVAVGMQFELKTAAIVFTALLSIGTGLLFGMYPALHSTRTDLSSVLKASSGQPSGARSAARFRTALVTAQISLSMALLVGAGLFIKSLANLSRVELGLEPENVVAFSVAPDLNGYETEDMRVFYDRLEQELAAVPGVVSASAGLVPVLSGSNWGTDVSVQGFESGPDIDSNSRYNEVGPGYFQTLGMNLLSGREFTVADDQDAPKVAVVNQAFAQKFGLDEREVVGTLMSTRSRTDELDMQIVGLVQDASYSEVKGDVPPLFFIPYRQGQNLFAMTFYARTGTDARTVMRQVPDLIKRLDPNLPVAQLKTMTQQVKESVFLERLIGTLSSAFALLATILAAVGLYGVLAYTVAQRTREIGLRMALGADGSRVRRMVLSQVTRMTVVGGVIGLALAFGLGRAARSMLYELDGFDPTVVVLSLIGLAVVAVAAALAPAFRASGVDPMQALRYE